MRLRADFVVRAGSTDGEWMNGSVAIARIRMNPDPACYVYHILFRSAIFATLSRRNKATHI